MALLRPVSLALVAAVLAACTPSPATVGPSASPSQSTNSPAPSAASGSAAPTSSPSAGASASVQPGLPAPSASPSAAVSSAPVSSGTGILKGAVYASTKDFAPDGTSVSVKSLDASQPYTGSTTTASGNYVLNSVPLDVQLEVTATRPGWTSRSRVMVLRAPDPNLPNRNIYNFGGPTSTDDPAGPGFFISDYPEVESVEPADQDTSQPNDRMQFKLVLSEPFDETNQRRLASAFLIVPNSQEALGPTDVLADPASTSVADLSGLRVGTDPLTKPAYRYRQNAGYLNGYAVSGFKWDSDNRTATFTLQAPVKTGSLKEAAYAFLLVNQTDDKIVDPTNKPLGMDSSGHWGGYTKQTIIYNAIKKTGLVLTSGLGGKDEDRWIDTHQTWTQFTVAKDTTPPTLVSVLARRNYTDDTTAASDRVEFTFSKPMVAFPNIMSSSLLSLNNYIVTAAVTSDDLASRDIAGASSHASAVKTTDTFDTVQTAIKGTYGMVVDFEGASAGNFSIKLSVNDPKVVILSLPGGSLPLDANFVKAYAGNDSGASSGAKKTVGDPAGNNIDPNACTAIGPIF